MSVLFEEIEKQSKELVPREKAALARKLIADLDREANDEVEQLWIEEAEQRLDGYLRGEIEARPVDEVMSRVRNLLR